MLNLLRAITIIVIVLISVTANAQTPQVINISPAKYAQNVAPDAEISVTFDQDMDPSTINVSSFIVRGELSGTLDGVVSYSSGSRTAYFTPTNEYHFGEQITVSLTTEIASSGLSPMADPYIWTFTVLSETAPATFSSRSTYPLETDLDYVESADLDNDGDIDIVAINSGYLAIYVFLNDGNGRFKAVEAHSTGFRPTNAVLADIDNDYDIDIIAPISDDGEIITLLNDGSASFTPGGNYPAGSGAKSVCAADFDGDGDLDAATANYTGDSITVLMNDGNGVFSFQAQLAAGHQPSEIIACDLDGDADLDLAVSNRSWNATRLISLYFNDGSGNFGNQVNYAATGYPSSIACGDLDSDGDLDIVVGEGNNSEGVLVYMNDGTGTLSAYVEYPVGQTPNAVCIRDYDGDGDLDIATANYLNATVSILLNNGDGTLAPHYFFNAAFRMYGMTAADFNGDGGIDLAVPNADLWELTILLNEKEILVTNLDDAGVGSLRWAIESANADSSIRNIVFEPDANGTIALQTPLPAIAGYGDIAIRGYSPLDSWTGPQIRIDGSDLTGGNGFEIVSSGNLIDWLIISNFPDNGIVIPEASARYNSITNNNIYGNGLLGIDLGGDGVTVNDPGDGDSGANDLLNYPEIDSLVVMFDSTYYAYGRSAPGSKVDLFLVAPGSGLDSVMADPSGHGEGFDHIFSTYADDDGRFLFEYIPLYSWDFDNYLFLSLIATDTLGNSSEFSLNYSMTGELTITAHSPVNLWVTGPNGDYIGKDAAGNLYQTMPQAEYTEEAPDYLDIITINVPDVGEYLIEVVTEDGADPASTYSVGVKARYTGETMLVVDRTVPAALEKDEIYFTIMPNWLYMNGDADRSGQINILDVTFIINYLYKGGVAPMPVYAADADCNLTVNILDVTRLVNYLYKSGAAPCE